MKDKDSHYFIIKSWSFSNYRLLTLNSRKFSDSEASTKYSNRYFNSKSSKSSFHSMIGIPFDIYSPKE